MSVTINLPTEFDFRRSGVVFRCDPSALSPEMIVQLVLHGIVQKVGDSAAGKDEQAATDAMNATWANLAAGDWGKTREGSSDPLASYRQGVMRDMLKQAGGEAWKGYKKHKEAKDRIALLDTLIAAQSEEGRAAIESAAQEAKAKHEAEAARRKAEADKLAASGIKLSI